ncbi:GAS domain-containing protein [Elizabethkingia ursingii]|uniref:GAS domain-containing protein n=1 Tax=Elizabethkingia ursingii TaxID=1756150 RepID=UPI002011F646|nr:GAS domain-containing protein [Elizabethkingia ursingii]MCL1666891.1 GAS domain-containing protein [Elizabethkingia ursingii]
MKKISILLFSLPCFYFAQLATPQGQIQTSTNPETGNIGIGTTTPEEKLDITNGFLKIGYVSVGHSGAKSPKNAVSLGSDNHGSVLLGSNLYLNYNPLSSSDLKTAITHPTLAGAGIVIPGNSQENQGSIIFHTKPPAPTTTETIFNSPRMIIKENGNVGIGTLNPENSESWDKVLEVKGDLHSKIITSSSNIITGTWSHEVGYHGSPIGGLAGTYTNHPYSLITNKTPKMTISADGNIGIGTTNPENSESWNRVLEVKGNETSKFINSTSTISTGIWSHDYGFYGSPAGGMAGTSTNHPYSLVTNKTPKMTISTDGNIGIGTTNPQNKLDVNGTLHAKEVKVDMIGWADFVFEKDYQLPTLDEVEQHIHEKGHLPNIPNTKEVTKNGLSLGESQKLLLQKIEELTLYSIEQNKLNKEQSELLRQQQQEIQELRNEIKVIKK